MAQPATNGNILTKLDQRVPTRFYWQLTLLATRLLRHGKYDGGL